jgi:predicted transcriptional regulator
MSEVSATVESRVRLSGERARRLTRLAEAHHLSEDQVIAKALDILFSVTDILDAQAERRGWSVLSEDALQRVWDN